MEVKRICQWCGKPFMEKYRDLFMLGFYLIGINLSDLLELPADCITILRPVARNASFWAEVTS